MILQYVYPIAFVLFIWWFSTGAILYLDGLPRHTFRYTLAGSTVVLLAALAGLRVSSTDMSLAGAYCAFTCAVLVWGWQEVAFLLGYVTGSRRSACPPGASGWVRLRYALQVVAHHELALVVLALAVFFTTQDGANQTGFWTYVVLWIMRQSAKLNVFLGVRNLNESFLPPHLKYLESYFARRPMNALFPWSVTLSTVFAVGAWQSAVALQGDAAAVARVAFPATMLALAILEHWFLVVPLPSEALWKWGLLSRKTSQAQGKPAKLDAGRVVAR